MIIEIWKRNTEDDDKAVIVCVDGKAISMPNIEAAQEYLDGLARELQSASATAMSMYLRTQQESDKK